MDRDIVIPRSELRWAIASMASTVAGLSLMIACLVTKADAFLFAVAALFVLYGVFRLRLAFLEERREPASIKRRPLSLYLFFLVLIYPFVAGLFTILFVIAALVKGGDILAAVGRGAVSGAILVFGAALLDGIGRIARWIFFKKRPAAPPAPPIP